MQRKSGTKLRRTRTLTYLITESWLLKYAVTKLLKRSIRIFTRIGPGFKLRRKQSQSNNAINLSEYDEETQHYDETKRDASRKQLIENIMKVVKPTYLSVVEHMRHAILEKFEQAAMDELKKNGVLVAMKTHKYSNEFKNQLKDAAVKQANWNQDTEQLAQLESEIDRTKEEIRATNELLEKQKARKLQIMCLFRKLVDEIINDHLVSKLAAV
ncbi:unnamed protein product [Coffea canephora]|uniref:DH200=94 genomic scaffold, scaffold_2134 n=1 Tax=Coffea canephora TaxID=49390 RepID=A0A068VK42_COFCA|nr:unnamed protein product [Coffea canephora]